MLRLAVAALVAAFAMPAAAADAAATAIVTQDQAALRAVSRSVMRLRAESHTESPDCEGGESTGVARVHAAPFQRHVSSAVPSNASPPNKTTSRCTSSYAIAGELRPDGSSGGSGWLQLVPSQSHVSAIGAAELNS